jgi:hypothetical protein
MEFVHLAKELFDSQEGHCSIEMITFQFTQLKLQRCMISDTFRYIHLVGKNVICLILCHTLARIICLILCHTLARHNNINLFLDGFFIHFERIAKRRRSTHLKEKNISRMPYSGMWRSVHLVLTDVSEERIVSIFRV